MHYQSLIISIEKNQQREDKALTTFNLLKVFSSDLLASVNQHSDSDYEKKRSCYLDALNHSSLDD